MRREREQRIICLGTNRMGGDSDNVSEGSGAIWRFQPFNNVANSLHRCWSLRVTSKGVYSNGPKLNEYVIAEDYITGTFKKWCNNYGYIHPEAENTAISMPAFMHWSWVQSSGQLMVADLQGVRKDNHYHLTDPAINSVYGTYGATDMRAEGMAMFFLHHKCNDICKRLPRPTVRDFTGIIPQKDLAASLALLQQVQGATTYSTELNFTPEVRTGIARVFQRVAGQ